MRLRGPALTALLITAGAVTLSGCGDGSAAADPGGKLKVVATTTVVADFARVVGGDRAEVTQIIKPNVDAHDYEPSPADLAAIGEADVVVKNGVGLEKWFDQTISAAGFDGRTVDASSGVTLRAGSDADEGSGHDPHIWHDPRNAEKMVTTIADGFAAADPDDAGAYRARLATYVTKVTALDADVEKQIATIPVAQRKLVTNHDAFGYYAARYGLQVVGAVIPSFDSSAELSGSALSGLVTAIKQSGTRAVFAENTLPPKTAQTVAREAGVRVVDGEDALYGDGLGPADSAAGTYLTMIEHNTKTIVDALAG